MVVLGCRPGREAVAAAARRHQLFRVALVAVGQDLLVGCLFLLQRHPLLVLDHQQCRQQVLLFLLHHLLQLRQLLLLRYRRQPHLLRYRRQLHHQQYQQ